MFISFIIEIFLSCSVLMQLLFNTKLRNERALNFLLLDNIMYSQLVFIIVSTILLSSTIEAEYYFFNGTFTTSSNLVKIKIFILILSLFLTRLIFLSYRVQKLNFIEFSSLFLISLLAALLIINSNNLISFYICIEMQSLCFYLLSALKRNSTFSSEAGLKYFVGSSFMTGLFLLGSSLIYVSFGSLSLQNICLLNSYELDNDLFMGLFKIGVALVTCFLLYKVGCAPFHFLYPDVYEGSPLASTIVLTTLPYFSMYCFFFTWVVSLNVFFNQIQELIIFCALISIITGTFFAVSQLRIKRLLIYSSISQTGFLILALSINLNESLSIVYLYLVVYLMTLILTWGFFFILSSYKKDSFAVDQINPLLISSISNLSAESKVLSFSFIVILFSIGGIPPMLGFFPKIFVLKNLLNENLFIYSVIIITISSFSVFYYLRLLKSIFFEPKVLEKNISEFLLIKYEKFNSMFMIFSFILFLLCFLSAIPELLFIFLSD